MKGRAVNAAIVEAVHDADARPVRRRIALAFQLGDLIAIERAQAHVSQGQQPAPIAAHRGDGLHELRMRRRLPQLLD